MPTKRLVVSIVVAYFATGTVLAASPRTEKTASAGPVKLTFRVDATTVSVGQFPWFQIKIDNIGAEELFLIDPIFSDPADIRHNYAAKYGIYLEVIGPDGKPLPLATPRDAHRNPAEASGLLEVRTPEERALVENWRKDGLSQHEIDRKLIDYHTKRERREGSEESAAIILQPGESAQTKSSYHYSDIERIRKQPIPAAKGDFARLEAFDFDKSGDYRIRAVYNYSLSPDGLRRARKGKRSTYGMIKVQTDWISIKVR